MAHIGASIARLDLAGAELDLGHSRMACICHGSSMCLFRFGGGCPSARRSNGLSFSLCTILVSYSGEIASLGQYLCMIFF